MPLTKLHGTRNDFVLIDHRNRQSNDYAALARFLCNRRIGVGADGLLVILLSSIADVRMRIFNADGSEAQMCGNGIRCVAAYLTEGRAQADFQVETLAGMMSTHATLDGDRYIVRVKVPSPQIEPAGVPNSYVVQAGNPNVVIFGDALEGDLPTSGSQISSRYKDGANVHIGVVEGTNRIRVRHWERGVGETMSCGTGAVAVAAAAIAHRGVASPVEVCVPGGKLIVEWDGVGDATLTGEAVRVFDASVWYDSAVYA